LSRPSRLTASWTSVSAARSIPLGIEHRLHQRIGNRTVQSIGTEHDRLAVGKRQFVDADLEVGPRAHHRGQHVAHGMSLQCARLEPRLALEQGDPRVVRGQRRQLRAQQRVDAAVADAGEGHARAIGHRRDHRRAHAGVLGMLLGRAIDAAVGDFEAGHQPIGRERQRRVDPERPGDVLRCGALRDEGSQRIDGELRGDLAGVVAAHPIRDDDQAERRVPQDRVFVDRAHGAGMRARADRQHEKL
jgi:hypothetical protein